MLTVENMENLEKEKKKIKISLGYNPYFSCVFLNTVTTLAEIWNSAHSLWNLGVQEGVGRIVISKQWAISVKKGGDSLRANYSFFAGQMNVEAHFVIHW